MISSKGLLILMGLATTMVLTMTPRLTQAAESKSDRSQFPSQRVGGGTRWQGDTIHPVLPLQQLHDIAWVNDEETETSIISNDF